MVAWDMSNGHVDEFWRISELKLMPWQSVRQFDEETQSVFCFKCQSCDLGCARAGVENYVH